ncbi:hypothetical protein N7468_005931 [Penicillium chermesinum]|uniref:Uncharacterized protein n=1 Tax=Penicillium chermesinum TaxID=63820 RepID=A0A9W9TNF6_9EURO|nr:uncharacterized protein N7468_005931 [Penicillium chermesinum]KAJ5232975.1 hypothetical protein N7468_005931 [Penicillium chermesinum]
MIRFKAADSDVVPIPTDSLNLPGPDSLDTRQKVGIWIVVLAAVLRFSFYAFRYYRRSRVSKKSELPLRDAYMSMPPDPNLERDRSENKNESLGDLRERAEVDGQHEIEMANEIDPPQLTENKTLQVEGLTKPRLATLDSEPTAAGPKSVDSVGGLDSSTDHASTDIQQGMDMGLDAFALNVGAPTADWAKDAVDQLFKAAGHTNGKFKLFFSFDLSAWDNLQDHIDLFNSYSSDFKKHNAVSLIPNLDTQNIDKYYNEPSSYLAEFVDIVDGFFSWESAWPAASDTPSNLSSTWDRNVMDFAHGASKAYMMGKAIFPRNAHKQYLTELGLSALQFKDCCGGNYYRIGEANLPQRMSQILDIAPDLVEVITWNDGGESHYIGNLWDEAYSGPDALQYANMSSFPHNAWQPLITSFINAFKAGSSASEMAPPGSDPIGAFWYHPVLKNCDGIDSIDNIGSAQSTVNYAVVLPADSQGVSIKITSGGNQIAETQLSPGLNFAAVTGQSSGAQKVELVSNGQTFMCADSPSNVPANPEMCNFNFVVVGLESSS